MILAFCGQKGGIGKSTTALNVAAQLALDGRRTLLVDGDPQASLTRMSGAPVGEETLATVIGQNAPGTGNVLQAIVPVADYLDILPSETLLAQTELGLVLRLNRERQLQLVLAKVADQYDDIVIDSPPSLGLITINILLAAEHVIIPTQLESESVAGLNLFLRTIEETRTVYPDAAQPLGTVVTMVELWKEHEPRLVLARDLHAALRERPDIHLFETMIPRSASVSEAALMRQTIQQYDPEGRAAQAIANLTSEIIERTSDLQ